MLQVWVIYMSIMGEGLGVELDTNLRETLLPREHYRCPWYPS
jgi:hypothetical protein